MCDFTKPDVIVIQNDGWNIQGYIERLKAFKEYANIPVIAIVAVDGKNFRGRWLDGITHAIFWTQFGLDEARAGGYRGPASVIPLGVDLSIYKPTDKMHAREQFISVDKHRAFIIGNFNRNQPRKRWDLTIKYFAEWMYKMRVTDAYLMLHAAPTGDTGVDIGQLARYYKVEDRVGLIAPDVFYGFDETVIAQEYGCLDLFISTTQGEGMGLTALEAMACGIPCVLPDWSAFGDWARDAAWLVKCPTTHIGPPYVNVIGGVPDQDEFMRALSRMYIDKQAREQNGQAALERAQESRFRWANIGKQYVEVLAGVLNPVEESVAQV